MIKNNINYILENIAGIKQKNGIDYDINLVAVTKNFPAEDVLEAYNCGITLFGENRIQEADIKYNSDILKEKKLELHIIGHLQRNKAKTAVKIASMIQSIDKIETL
nr:YggS family pyridoxal phosphate-dependent enzyme [Spirochaetota bacterium]